MLLFFQEIDMFRMKANILCILIAGFVSCNCFADAVDDRSTAILNQFYDYYKNSSDVGQLPVTVRWCYAALVLDKDANRANQVLNDYLAPKQDYFTKLGGHGHDLYWELPLLIKIAADKKINIRLEPRTDTLIKGLLWDFCKTMEPESSDIADTSSGKLLRVFNSDNHDMIQKTIFFFSAQLLKNDPKFKDLKYQTLSSHSQRYTAWVNYMMAYFRQRAATGGQIEFASSGYTGVYLQPVFLIRDCAEDEHVRQQADKYLTLYFADAAQELLNGIRGGAKVRCYKTYQWTESGKHDLMTYYSHLFFGTPRDTETFPNKDCLVSLVTSWRPPQVVVNLATHPDKKGSYEYISSRLADGRNEFLNIELVPGQKAPLYFPAVPSHFRRYTYATPSYVLGTFTIDETKQYLWINAQNQWMGRRAPPGRRP
jgi:hypothetical protein